MYIGHSVAIPTMPEVSIKLVKDCVLIEISGNEMYYIKKECILGLGVEILPFSSWFNIYTNIPKANIRIELQRETANEDIKNYTKIVKNIISPEVPEVDEPTSNMLRN
jgi:hypothetical protein